MRFLILALCVVAFVAPARIARAADSETLAADGKWSEAIEAYSKEIAGLSAQQYRDKKDFGWTLEEYEKKSPGDYAAMKKVVADLLAKYRGQEVMEWRLHRLAGEIAKKSSDAATYRQELELAIKSYPAKIEGEPSKHSSLQHLYNERALLDAEKDPKAAEDYILKSFKADPRFVYFFTHPWREFYQSAGNPQGLQQLLQKVRKAYDEKAAAQPKNAALLKRYAVQLSQEMKQQ